MAKNIDKIMKSKKGSIINVPMSKDSSKKEKENSVAVIKSQTHLKSISSNVKLFNELNLDIATDESILLHKILDSSIRLETSMTGIGVTQEKDSKINEESKQEEKTESSKDSFDIKDYKFTMDSLLPDLASKAMSSFGGLANKGINGLLNKFKTKESSGITPASKKQSKSNQERNKFLAQEKKYRGVNEKESDREHTKTIKESNETQKGLSEISHLLRGGGSLGMGLRGAGAGVGGGTGGSGFMDGLLTEIGGELLEHKLNKSRDKTKKTKKTKVRKGRSRGKFGKIKNVLNVVKDKIPGLGKGVKSGGGILSKGKGLISKGAGKIGGKGLASAGKIGLKSLRFLKVAGPIGAAVTAGMAIYDGVKGFQEGVKNASEILNKNESELTGFDKKAAGVAQATSSVIEGLTFGLVDIDAKSIYDTGKKLLEFSPIFSGIKGFSEGVKNASEILNKDEKELTEYDKKVAGYAQSTASIISGLTFGLADVQASTMANIGSTMMGWFGLDDVNKRAAQTPEEKAKQGSWIKRPSRGVFKKGGYTGSGDVNDISGTVHKEEFVIHNKALNEYGQDVFENINNNKMQVLKDDSGKIIGLLGGNEVISNPNLAQGKTNTNTGTAKNYILDGLGNMSMEKNMMQNSSNGNTKPVVIPMPSGGGGGGNNQNNMIPIGNSSGDDHLYYKLLDMGVL